MEELRKIEFPLIRETVARLCQQANFELPPDICAALRQARQTEPSATGQAILDELIENAALAREKQLAICQDTGMAVVFVRLGQQVQITGGSLYDAVQAGVAQGYRDGYLRASVVADPLLRGNTGDNTPAVIHYEIVPGDRLEITVAPKGFGSENMSAVRMLSPSAGIDGVRQFVLETIRTAGPNPCPPVIVGVGLGGTFEKVTELAKRALLRPVGSASPKAHLASLEQELLAAINASGIGPAGLGGRTTALAVHIEAFPTHIASLPVAVNMSCHATRHATWLL
jgi:fumarate hydratase subunit alpha